MISDDLQQQINKIILWLNSHGVAEYSFPIFKQTSKNSNELQECPAYRWQKSKFASRIHPIWNLPEITLDSLIGIDIQKQRIVENTEFFLNGQRTNNVLLTGARGSGKSSLIRALLNKYYQQGLRVIEVDRESIGDWHNLVELLQKQEQNQQKYILFFDDLSFEQDEYQYKSLKSLLDGGFEVLPKNAIIYATSNRRHLVSEEFKDNLSYHQSEKGEIHPGEVVEEKISLSDRFGIWLSFYSIDQETYWLICKQWLTNYGYKIKQTEEEKIKTEAIRWALNRGGRNGRIAEQFARYYCASCI